MAERAAARPRRRRSARPSKRPPRPRGWWGTGPAPWDEFPGVTIRIPAVWVAKRKRWESPDGQYWYDAAEAELKCDFFPTFLRHSKGEFAGQPFTLLRYQMQLIVKPLFGWKRTADNLRRFRRLFLAVPKGGGKSPMGSGLGIILTMADGEGGAEVYAAATDKDQARIVHDAARGMVEDAEDLRDIATVLKDAIWIPSTRSVFRAISSEVAGSHGPNVHGLIVDELHAQTSRDLFESLSRGTMKRSQPVVAMLTHAGDDDESICAEEWEFAAAVIRDPSRDETYLPVIFEAKPDDDPWDPKVWSRVNPGFGITVKADAFAREATAARLEPRKRNDFFRFNLNRWVNSAVAWIPIEWWDACAGPVDQAALTALQVSAGLDLSQKYDLAAFVLTFRHPLAGAAEKVDVVGTGEDAVPIPRVIEVNFEITVVPHFWLPEDTLRERVEQDRVRYDLWRDAGLLTVTEGNAIDYDRILRDIIALRTRYPLLKQGEIGYDPAFATQLAIALQKTGFRCVELPQNYRNLSEPAQVFEALLKGKRVHHDGHRLMRWNVENVSIRRDDAGRIRPVKPRRQQKRIDGVVATLMGLSRLYTEPPAPPSVYGTRGVRTV